MLSLILGLLAFGVVAVVISLVVDAAQHKVENRRFAAMDGAAKRFAETCELCNGTAVYLCPICRTPIKTHSHENDYICETHSFINPIRQQDEARINGDGRPGPLRLVGR